MSAKSEQEGYADALVQAEKLLTEIPYKEFDRGELQEINAATEGLRQAAGALRGLKTDGLITLSDKLTDLVSSFMRTQEWLAEDHPDAAKAAMNAIFGAKGFVTAMGLRYFSKQAVVMPKRKKMMIVALIVLFVCVAVGAGVGGFLVYKRKKKAQDGASTVSSKRGKSGAYEMNTLNSIFGAPVVPDMGAIADVCTYSFLTRIYDVDEADAAAKSVVFKRLYFAESAGAPKHVLTLECQPSTRTLSIAFCGLGTQPPCAVFLEELPLYKWFTVHVSVNSTNAKIYLNGKLVRNFYLHTCGYTVHTQKGTSLMFPHDQKNSNTSAESPFLKLRYFKAHPGELDDIQIWREASELLKEVAMEKEQSVRDKCKTKIV